MCPLFYRIFIHNVGVAVVFMTFFVNMSAVFTAFTAYLFLTRVGLSLNNRYRECIRRFSVIERKFISNLNTPVVL